MVIEGTFDHCLNKQLNGASVETLQMLAFLDKVYLVMGFCAYLIRSICRAAVI